mgnify:CR=1 FL=1
MTITAQLRHLGTGREKKEYEKSSFIRKNIIQHTHFVKIHPLFLSYLGSFS